MKIKALRIANFRCFGKKNRDNGDEWPVEFRPADGVYTLHINCQLFPTEIITDRMKINIAHFSLMGGVSILQIILYYRYKALHNDTLPTEIITDSIKK